MRQALKTELREMMSGSRLVHLLTADTGFHVFDDLQKEFPEQYLNVGIAEASMIGIAAGLAHCGRQVFVYAIAPFTTMRCLEQIRVDVCYENLPVRVVGVGAGLTYGPAGPTHHAVEDIAVLSCLPNLTVICPGDAAETALAVRATRELPGPCYLRIGKSGEPAVHDRPVSDFRIGKGIVLRRGVDVALIATGNMLYTAREAADALAARGISAGLVSMHTLKPLDTELVQGLARRCSVVATVEEHMLIGGLGSMVAGVMAREKTGAVLKAFGIPDCYAHRADSQQALRESYGLTSARIADTLARMLRGA